MYSSMYIFVSSVIGRMLLRLHACKLNWHELLLLRDLPIIQREFPLLYCDIINAIRLGKRPAVFKVLQWSKTSLHTKQLQIQQKMQRKAPKLWDLHRCTGRNFFCRQREREGCLWQEISPFEIRFCSKEHLNRHTRYASYPIHPAGQLVRCQSDPLLLHVLLHPSEPFVCIYEGLGRANSDS